MRRIRTLRSQLIAWLAAPLIVLWMISTTIDYDVSKRFVNLAYDRALLEAALDSGRQVKVVIDRVYVDLPEFAVGVAQIEISQGVIGFQGLGDEVGPRRLHPRIHVLAEVAVGPAVEATVAHGGHVVGDEVAAGALQHHGRRFIGAAA